MELALTTQLDEMRSINTTAARQNAQAGWLRTGKLWSGLKEVCDLLRIATGPLVADTDYTFTHVQYKTGQRIYNIGHPCDLLYMVISGFLIRVLFVVSVNVLVLSFPLIGDMLGVDGIH